MRAYGFGFCVIDALQNADQLIVTPEGSNTLIQPK